MFSPITSRERDSSRTAFDVTVHRARRAASEDEGEGEGEEEGEVEDQ